MQAGVFVPQRAVGLPRVGAVAGRSLDRLTAWLVPSLAQVIFLSCLLLALKFGSLMVSADGDPGRHLTVGEHILATGFVPRQDVFSHTMAGEPFVPYEWLAEVASAASYRWAGLAGPVLLHGSIIGLSFAILFRQLQGRGNPLLLAVAIAALAAVASTVHWLARPHVFSFLGTAVFSALLDGWQAGRLRGRWLWALPPAMLVWANTHGGFLIGFVLLGAYAGADVLRSLAGDIETASAARHRLRVLWPVIAATLAATVVNPAGPALWAHVTGYFGKQSLVDSTIEYMSPNFHGGDVRFFLAMLLATVASMLWSRRRPALHEGLLLLGFTYFALYSTRNIPLFAIVVAPILAAQLAALPVAAQYGERTGRLLRAVHAWLSRRNDVYARMDGRSRGFTWPVVAVAGLLVLAAAQQREGQAPLGLQFSSLRQPVAAAAYLKANPPAGNGFNKFVWGGYLLHELWPAQRVFIDGQTDFYGEALTREYWQIADTEIGWQDALDRRDVQWVVFDTDSVLVRQLASSPAWQVAYVDRQAAVLIRTNSAESAR